MMLVIWCLLILVSTAAEGSNSTCGDKFPCFDGSCVNKEQWCDNDLDCVDGTDEKYCSFSTNFESDPNNCSETFFRCKDGPCIPLVGRCDGFYSCYDRSDEIGCITPNTPIEIGTKSTISFFERPETNAPTEFFAVKSTESGLEIVPISSLSDSISSSTTNIKDLDSDDFVALNASQFKGAKIKAQLWLLKIRSPNYGWEEETARAFTALHLSEDGLDLTISERLLMKKQLHLKILAALLKNESSPASLVDLSLYMNALTASCENTKNFYGHDLVSVLRQRVDMNLESSKFSNPLVYLTLCLNNATTKVDLGKIKGIVHDDKFNRNRVGVLALASLAATCISRTSKFSTYPIGMQVASHLHSAVVKQGLPDNVYELALVTQALNEARINEDSWNRSDALKLIANEQDSDGSFGNILSTYYAIPVLLGKSLLSVKHCSSRFPDAALDVQNGESRKIRYSLYFGEPVTTSISLTVQVKKTSSIFDIMRKAAAMNPSYELRYSSRKGKPNVYSVGGVANDPEHGMYWKLYLDRHHSFTNSSLLPYEDDIRLLIPASGDSIVYWMKSIY